MHHPPRIFDRSAYAKRRARAERGGSESFLVGEVAQNLFERVSAVTRSFALGLDVGSRRQSFAQLEPLAEAWVRAPLSLPHTSSTAPLVVTDEECLPFADSSFELVVSVLSLHAVNDLPGALLQIRKLLVPGGLFVAALLGGSTLRELRQALAAGENETLGGISPRVAPFADVRDLGGLLQRAGFSMPVADRERVVVHYGAFTALVADLRALGETNVLMERLRVPLQRATLLSAVTHYAARDAEPDGRLRATFETIYLTGWAPESSGQ
ncbi:MAG TPA: methyltransferase domain-containing protein [Rhizomicrobium sp.]